jgi:hypothetical protein
VRRIASQDSGLPGVGETGVCLRLNLGLLKFPHQFSGGVVGEAQIGGGEILVNHGRSQKTGELLLFDRVAGHG